MSIDGNLNLGDPNSTGSSQTPSTLSATALLALTLAAAGYAGVIGDGAIVLPHLDAAGVMEPQSNLTMATCTPTATAVARNIAAGAATLPRYALAATQLHNNTAAGDCALLPPPLNGTMVLDIIGVGDARACSAKVRCSRCGAGSISRRWTVRFWTLPRHC